MTASMTASMVRKATCTPCGPSVRAIDSARMRCAALVASKLQERQHIHFEFAPQHRRLDAHEVATGAADSIAQHHTGGCCMSR